MNDAGYLPWFFKAKGCLKLENTKRGKRERKGCSHCQKKILPMQKKPNSGMAKTGRSGHEYGRGAGQDRKRKKSHRSAGRLWTKEEKKKRRREPNTGVLKKKEKGEKKAKKNGGKKNEVP